MHTLPTLKPGDTVEIIAPASRCTDKHLNDIKTLLDSWQLNCLVADDIFGDDLLCANSDAHRLAALKKALLNPDTKAVICARGGYGSMRLIPSLADFTPPSTAKLFIGMSDITALNLYFEQEWQWPTLHGALAVDKFSPESIAAMKSLLFGETPHVEFTGVPLNAPAKKNHMIDAVITGGNLCIVQSGIGTSWQMKARNKIIFLEEVGERGYRVDRMLEQLHQAKVFDHAAAIVFGDFTGGNEPDGSSLVQPVLERFAQSCDIPVIQIAGVGHGQINFPLPLGSLAKLQLGGNITLIC